MAGWREGLQLQWQRSSLFQRWQALPSRDRLALTVLGAFLVLVMAYLLLWQPALRGAQAARSAFEEQRSLHAYLQHRAPELRGHELQPRVSVDPARLQGLVTASAAEQGLAIERLDAEGYGAVQVSLQAAPFEQLLRWLRLLEGQGVRIEEAGMERRGAGQVAARFGLRAGE